MLPDLSGAELNASIQSAIKEGIERELKAREEEAAAAKKKRPARKNSGVKRRVQTRSRGRAAAQPKEVGSPVKDSDDDTSKSKAGRRGTKRR